MDAKLKVMVVEDEELLLQAISKKLTSQNIDVITSTSAKQAIDYLNNMKAPPDAIWLDYYLPDMNGIEFMREIKKNPAWSKIPVIVVSNSASDEKKKSMIALGVEKYILKAEHRLEEIIEIIENIAAKKKVE